MEFSLGPKALARGYRLASFDTIASTNTEALARGRAGDPGRLWVVSSAQTAGRGRRGRVWQTPPGNLAATLLLVDPSAQPHTATLGFVAGLAVLDAIRSIAPRAAAAKLSLKWPNDVLADGAKLAGILLQAASDPVRGTSVAIGIGVNVAHAPDGLPYPATTLSACGIETDAAALFAALSDAWVDQEEAWDRGRGFALIRERWLDRAAGLGAPIAIRLGETTVRGVFDTIDGEGQLVLRAPDGSSRRVAAGEVHFGAAARLGIHG